MGYINRKQLRVLDCKALTNTKDGNPRYRLTCWNAALEEEQSFNTEANAGFVYRFSPHTLIETFVDLELYKPRKNWIITGLKTSRFQTLSEYKAYNQGGRDAYYGRNRFNESYSKEEKEAYALGHQEEPDRKQWD